MKRIVYLWLVLAGFAFLYSCSNSAGKSEALGNSGDNTIVQQSDGTISLKLEKAECYHDLQNPVNNTAEWNVVVSKSGRFNVWLSSATKDTTRLQYQNKVMLNILDKRLEVSPECDKIVLNSSDVSYPFYRADSFVGSLYLQDTGTYNIQVISEKILPKESGGGVTDTDNTRLISVFFTPATR